MYAEDSSNSNYHDPSYQQLKEQLYPFLNASTFAKGRKTLHGLPPYEYTIEPGLLQVPFA